MAHSIYQWVVDIASIVLILLPGWLWLGLLLLRLHRLLPGLLLHNIMDLLCGFFLEVGS